MKVRIEFTVEVDAEGWAGAYGLTRTEVPADVRQYVTGLVEDSNAASREHYRPRGGTGREG